MVYKFDIGIDMESLLQDDTINGATDFLLRFIK